MSKLISVIAPCFNHSSYIERCIESIADQNSCSMELIVIDDCSVDDSFEKASSFVKNHHISSAFANAVVIKNDVNKGAYWTLNKGLSIARGSFITIINTDDEYAKDRFKLLLRVIHDNQLDLVFSGVSCISADSSDIKSEDMYIERSLDSLDASRFSDCFLMRNPSITTGNLFFRRTLVDAGLRFRELRYCHDWDFLLSSLMVGKVGWINKPLYRYRLHSANSYLDYSHIADIETLSVLANFSYNLHTHNAFDRIFGSYHRWIKTRNLIQNLHRAEIVNSSRFLHPENLPKPFDHDCGK